MRLAAPVLLAWLVAGVCGDGLRASYEKIMLFTSYQIDQLLPEDQQTIGFRCAEEPSRPDAPCPEPADSNSDKYIRCEGSDTVFDNTGSASTVKRPCKYLWEFMEFIDGKDYKGKELIKGTASGVQNKLDFNVDATAKNMNENGFDKAVIMWRVYKDTSSARRMIKGRRTYNGMLSSVFDSVAFAKSNLPDSVYEGNKKLFQRFEESSMSVAATRKADYNMQMMAKIREKEPDIKLASNPIDYIETHPKTGEVRQLVLFNEAETIDNNQAAITDVEKRLKAQIEAFKMDKFNNSHWLIIGTVARGISDVDYAKRSCT